MSEFRITSDNDFIRIFVVPKKFPTGYCFDGPKPVDFPMIDWFQVFSMTSLPIMIGGEQYEEKKKEIIEYVKTKPYYHDIVSYLILTDWGDAFLLQRRKE